MLRLRSIPALAAVALLAACTPADQQQPVAEKAPTAPAAARASLSAAPTITAVDTSSASSVCRTVVRERAAAAKKLEADASNGELGAQVGSLDAIVADVCQ